MTRIVSGTKNGDQVVKGEIVPAIVSKDGKVYVVVLAEDGLFYRVDIETHTPK